MHKQVFYEKQKEELPVNEFVLREITDLTAKASEDERDTRESANLLDERTDDY